MKTVRITIPFHDKPLVLIDHHEQPFYQRAMQRLEGDA